MQVYLFDNTELKLSDELGPLLESLRFETVGCAWTGSSDDVDALPAEPDVGGVVILPAVWADLLVVKAMQHILAKPGVWQVAVAGPSPDGGDLSAAFNAGLSQYILLPTSGERLRVIMRRLQDRWSASVSERVRRQPVDVQTQGVGDRSVMDEARRDAYLGRALMDLSRRRGPIVDHAVQVLYVCGASSSSHPIQQLLSRLGLMVDMVGCVGDAVNAVQKQSYAVVLSDYVLDGGDAVTMIHQMRQVLAEQMPYTVVLSSSSDVLARLSDPSSGVDEVVAKPDLRTGIEVVLPGIVAGAYQTLSGQ